jgi:hypothetical protein
MKTGFFEPILIIMIAAFGRQGGVELDVVGWGWGFGVKG